MERLLLERIIREEVELIGEDFTDRMKDLKSKFLKSKKQKTVITFADLLPKSLPEHSLAPFWLILDGFRMLFDGFGYHFSRILATFLQQHLQNANAASHETE